MRRGFLPRLETMDWGGSVVIPAASVSRAAALDGSQHCALDRLEPVVSRGRNIHTRSVLHLVVAHPQVQFKPPR